MLPRTVRGLARSGLLRTGLGQPQLVPVHSSRHFSRSTAIRQAQAPPSSSQSQYSAAFFSGGALALAVGLWWLHYGREPMAMERQATPAEGAATVVKQTPGAAPTAAPQSTPKSNTRHFTRAQVAEHTTKEKGVWVTFRGGVYDVTDFIAQHPGGDKLMLAAGSALEPFWKIYTIHDTDAVREILASYRIGELDPADAKAALAEAAEAARANPEDPFRTDPERSPLLVVRSAKPFNAETPPAVLVDLDLTPNDVFYVRHHLPVPLVEDEKTFALHIDTPHGTVARLSMDDLRGLPRVAVTATLQCAGNRRKEMKVAGPVQGLSWDRGAIGNATWWGVRLTDVLKKAGVAQDQPATIKHVQFEGLDGYGASIPLKAAFDPDADVVVAYQMNEETLPRDHGYPLRVVVPGVAGARSVKWVHKIILAEDESKSHWQRNDYKGFSPSADWDKLDWTASPSIQQMPVQSAILEPDNGATLAPDAEDLTLRGYAWSGGGRGIVRVDVSVDGGRTWRVADLLEGSNAAQEEGKKWAWTRWEATLPVDPSANTLQVVCKAVDATYNVQPDSFEGIYNRRGVLSNAWQRIVVHRTPSTDTAAKTA